MASTTVARVQGGATNPPAMGTLSASANSYYPFGTLVTMTAAGRAFAPVTADVSGQPAVGFSNASFDNRTNAEMGGLDDSGNIEVTYGVGALEISGTTPKPRDVVYVVDNQTISIDSLGGTRGFAGVVTEVRTLNGRTQAFVFVGPTAQSSGQNSTGRIVLNPTGALDIATGALLAVFADGASTTPGTQFTDSKTAGVRWNNHATPGAIAENFSIPLDLDPSKPLLFKARVSKVGATVGDATKLTVGAFFHVPGALHDADVDFGGDSSAIAAPAAASKTLQDVSLTFAAADLTAAPSGVCVTIKPKAGTLGTDDLILHEAWLEYSRK